MPLEIGTIEAIFRYPVKSMRGEAVDAATSGWHGIDGDRRSRFAGVASVAASRGCPRAACLT